MAPPPVALEDLEAVVRDPPAAVRSLEVVASGVSLSLSVSTLVLVPSSVELIASVVSSVSAVALEPSESESDAVPVGVDALDVEDTALVALGPSSLVSVDAPLVPLSVSLSVPPTRLGQGPHAPRSAPVVRSAAARESRLSPALILIAFTDRVYSTMT